MSIFDGFRSRRKPQTLKSTDLDGLVEYIDIHKPKNIVVLVGAGISTAAGIPDFRSPDTGIYHNLARLDLPTPESVFDISFFRDNPAPFYDLAHEIAPGTFHPTLAHCFIQLLHEKGILLRCFTQNIDTLERIAGVPNEKIVEAHGSFATNSCIDCRVPFDNVVMENKIRKREIPKCELCGGLVKPDIVFFGEALPERFFSKFITDLPKADLCIIMGTSLLVHPFASLPTRISAKAPRVLLNLEQVGDMGRRGDDVILLGRCDELVQSLATKLKWNEDLMKLYNGSKGMARSDKPVEEKESLEGKVDEITAGVGSVAVNDPGDERSATTVGTESGDRDGGKLSVSSKPEVPEETKTDGATEGSSPKTKEDKTSNL